MAESSSPGDGSSTPLPLTPATTAIHWMRARETRPEGAKTSENGQGKHQNAEVRISKNADDR